MLYFFQSRSDTDGYYGCGRHSRGIFTHLLPYVCYWIIRVNFLSVVSDQIDSPVHTDGAR